MGICFWNSNREVLTISEYYLKQTFAPVWSLSVIRIFLIRVKAAVMVGGGQQGFVKGEQSFCLDSVS